jgi:2'-5' RNA ligase
MRLFVGLELPWELRRRVARLAAAGIPGARWVPLENYHVTLRFIGETPRYLAEEIDHALAAVQSPAFALTLAGIGTFARGGRSQLLWLGIERSEMLERLQGKIETTLQRCGLEPERRRFQPHLTLARLDNASEARLASFVQANNLFRCDPVEIEHFTLFSSLLGKDQAVYRAEVEYGLGGRPAGDDPLPPPDGAER